METPNQLTHEFISFSRTRFKEMWPRLCECLDGLIDEQIWWHPNEASNSIGNLLLHLNGNVRQWILQGIGGIENVRDRHAEFAERGPIPVADLRRKLEQALHDVDILLGNLTPEDLLRTRHIQVYENVSGMHAVYHVVEHFAMHYGQILYIAKLVGGKDLGFYSYLNKTA